MNVFTFLVAETIVDARVLGNIIGVVATILVIWITTVKYRRNRRQLARPYAEYPRKAVPELDRGASQRNVMVIGGAGFLGYGEYDFLCIGLCQGVI
jgi:hypothetical protein